MSPIGSVIPSGGALIVFGGGAPAGLFGGATYQVSSTGMLGFNNTGDTLTLVDDGGATIDTMTYGSEGGSDTSLVRVPEYTGDFVQHSSDQLPCGVPAQGEAGR